MKQFFPSTRLGQMLMLLFPTTITYKKSQLSLPFNSVQILNIYHRVMSGNKLK